MKVEAPNIHRGARFGSWSVLKRHPGPRVDRQRQYLCRCACGTERVVFESSLRGGSSTSCGCSRRPDITGQLFGKWTPLRALIGRTRWVCRCSCGTEREVAYSALKRGTSLSCGCSKNHGARIELAIEKLQARAHFFGPGYDQAVTDLRAFASGKLP